MGLSSKNTGVGAASFSSCFLPDALSATPVSPAPVLVFPGPGGSLAPAGLSPQQHRSWALSALTAAAEVLKLPPDGKPRLPTSQESVILHLSSGA